MDQQVALVAVVRGVADGGFATTAGRNLGTTEGVMLASMNRAAGRKPLGCDAEVHLSYVPSGLFLPYVEPSVVTYGPLRARRRDPFVRDFYERIRDALSLALLFHGSLYCSVYLLLLGNRMVNPWTDAGPEPVLVRFAERQAVA